MDYGPKVLVTSALPATATAVQERENNSVRENSVLHKITADLKELICPSTSLCHEIATPW